MTRIATAYRTIKNNAFRYLFAVMGVFSPFLHLFALSGQEGPLHWKWMSSFLNALGWALFAFFIGLVMLLDVRDVAKEKRKPFFFRAFLVMGIGIYFILYIFFPNGKNFDFTRPLYYGALAVVSAAIVIFLIWVIPIDGKQVKKYKDFIRKLFGYIYDSEEDLKPETKESHEIKRGKLVHEALEHVGEG